MKKKNVVAHSLKESLCNVSLQNTVEQKSNTFFFKIWAKFQVPVLNLRYILDKFM